MAGMPIAARRAFRGSARWRWPAPSCSRKNVLLDEPTNGLDVGTRAVRDIIRKLRGEGHCVVFSSHVMQEVSVLCDSIIIVARGRIVAQGSPDELRQQTGMQDLEDVFVKLAGIEPQEAAS